VALVSLLLIRSTPAASTGDLADPDNPAYNGGQAVARVLATHGVTVVVARGRSALEDAHVDGDTTVLVANTSDLREPTTRSLADVASRAERLVLVRPERSVVSVLAPAVLSRTVFRQQEELVAGCATADVHPGEALGRSQAEYEQVGALEGCFTHDGFAVYLALPAAGSRPSTVLLGSTDAVTNAHVLDADNAAVVFRTLGHSARLVWYVPDFRDVTPTVDTASGDIFPAWFGPMVVLAAFALGAVMLWRGRRLGRLVTEPLPVTVRALETTQSRGGMYRRARDMSRASAVLREATRRRLAGYLGLPLGTPAEGVAPAAASASGRPADQVRWLLAGPPPSTEADLLGLAASLLALEKEIRRS
jgi:hypothetical protein